MCPAPGQTADSSTRRTAFLADARRHRLGHAYHATRHVIASAVAKTQCTEFFLDLCHHNWRHTGVGSPALNLTAKRVDQVKPAVAAGKAPGHATVGLMAFRKQGGVALAEQVVEFLAHGGVLSNRLAKRCYDETTAPVFSVTSRVQIFLPNLQIQFSLEKLYWKTYSRGFDRQFVTMHKR